MRQMITGLIAAVAVMAAAPAMACGYSPCAQQVYVAPEPVYSGCDPCGGGGYVRERLPDPAQQYYYVEQGPTYTGPGDWAPRRVYREGSVSGWNGYGYHRHHHHYRHYYTPRMGYHHGYAPRRAYAPQYSSRYAPAPYHHGQRVLRRYY
jgi:hypothetical protein